MREVELKKAAQTQQGSRAFTNDEFQERKKLQRAVQNAENKIAKLEKKIAAFEKEMAVQSFYELPDASKKMEQYEKAKSDLEKEMGIWENAQINLEKFE